MAAGGAERVAATIANAWADQGREVWLVPTFLGEKKLEYDIRTQVTVSFLSDYIVGKSVGWPKFIRKTYSLRRLVQDIRPDAVVSFLTNVNVLAAAALQGLGVPLVVSERADPAADIELPWFVRFGRAVLYQFADALVVQSASAAIGYRQRVLRPPPTYVVANPLPASLEKFERRAVQVGRGGEIVAMGRLYWAKRFDLLIRAFGLAFRDEPGWRLSIWGQGPLRVELEGLISELGLAERVHLRGVTREPWRALVAAQIFVLSSAYEGFPNAMLEAMAVGLACVSFDCPTGPRELSNGGEAVQLVSTGDIRELAAELSSLARDPERRAKLGRAAAEFVRSHYSEETVIEQWDAVISVAAKAGAARDL